MSLTVERGGAHWQARAQKEIHGATVFVFLPRGDFLMSLRDRPGGGQANRRRQRLQAGKGKMHNCQAKICPDILQNCLDDCWPNWPGFWQDLPGEGADGPGTWLAVKALG